MVESKNISFTLQELGEAIYEEYLLYEYTEEEFKKAHIKGMLCDYVFNEFGEEIEKIVKKVYNNQGD